MNKKVTALAIVVLLFGLAVPIVNLQANTISKSEENSQVITEDTI